MCEEHGHLIIADGCKPSSSERLAEVLGEIDADELEEAITAGMETIKKADDFHESVDGPDDETKYILQALLKSYFQTTLIPIDCNTIMAAPVDPLVAHT